VTKNGFLNGPLGLSRAPNGHLIAANAGDGNLVEIVPWEKAQVAKKLVDNTGMPPGAGTLFGLVAFSSSVYFVDDGSNTLNLLH
jgi:hypothetical protein